MSKNKKTYAAATQPAATTSTPAMFKEKIIFTVAIMLVAAIVLTGALVYVNYEEPIYTEISNTKPTTEASTATVKNGGFDFTILSEGDNVGAPYVAQNWRVTREGTSSTIMGILPTSSETWEKTAAQLNALGVTDITANPGTPSSEDKNDDEDTNSVYMISNVSSTYASIRNSSSFSVTSNSYNKLTLWVKTLNVKDGDAYVWLRKSTGSNAEDEHSFKSINTNGEWVQLTFYIEGRDSQSQSLYIDIGLGQSEDSDYDNATGTILIDDIVLTSSTKGDYLSKKDNTDAETERMVSFYEGSEYDNIVAIAEDGDFETISSAEYCEIEEAKFPFSAESIDVYKLTNTGDVKSKGGALTQNITVATPSTGTHYRLSFYVRTVDIPVYQGANIYLFDADDRTNTATTTYFSNIRTTADVEKDNLNGWVQYTFYIKPSNQRDFNIRLEFWLGSMINGESLEEAVTGTLYVTDFSLTEIKLSDYANASTGEKVKKVDLSSSTFSPVGTPTIENGTFDNIASNITPDLYPYVASSWTAVNADFSVLNNDVTFGIVTKGDERNTGLDITDADFAVDSEGSESQLYIRNNNSVSFGLTSDAFILAENTFFRISVVAKEINGGKANVYITGDFEMSLSMEEILASGKAMYSSNKVQLADGFVQFNFYVATGDKAQTVRLNLFNGIMNPKTDEEKTTGIVVYDMADYTELTEEDFTNLSKADVEDNEQVFESYDFVDENGEELTTVELTALFANVKGLDMSHEEVPELKKAPIDLSTDVDLPANPINWVSLVFAASSLIMVGVMIVVIVKTVRRNRKNG